MAAFKITSRSLFAAAFLAALFLTAASGGTSDAAPRRNMHGALVAFRSDNELRDFLRRHAARPRVVMDMAMPAPAAVASEAGAQAESTVMADKVAAPSGAAPGITNNQEAGVDEGDIVKLRGDILIVLRRGRLFTISIARGGMKPIDAINAYPPGVDASDDWYDEMLVAGDKIVVIGYSYGRGGTEINRFAIDREGHLQFVDAHQLRSNDYYSSRNYASRLIGHTLILYSPLALDMWGRDPLDSLPALRRWNGTGSAPGFQRIASARQIYIPPVLRDSPDAQIDTLHTVTTCDVTAPELDCSAMSVLGPDSRSFYVSGSAVYVWLSQWWPQYGAREKPVPSLLYRLPLNGGAPSAAAVRGAPIDQFSFREDASDGVLDVLVQSQGGGDVMWRPEFTQGAIALLRLPLARFGDGGREVEAARYRSLPAANGGDFHDRFVGDYMLYGAGNGWDEPMDGRAALIAVPVHGGEVARLPLIHGVDRIEAMGRDAVVVGSDSTNVYFTAIELGSGPNIGDTYSRPGAQSETRSHGFFFNPDAGGESGVLGLPVARPAQAAYHQLFENSASIVYVRRENRHFVPLGELDAANEGIVDDDCQASCVDWYGNARPIFYAGRAFALLGYELVEGALSDRTIRETARVSYAPAPKRASR